MARPQSPERAEQLQLRRWLGELDAGEAAELEALEAADPASRDRVERLRATWEELQPPPDLEAPTLAPRIMAAVRADESSVVGPLWGGGGRGTLAPRLAAVAVLLVGTALGVWLSPPLDPAASVDPTALSATLPAIGSAAEGQGEFESLVPEAAPSLAEAYWRALEETGGELSALDPGEPGS
ncbi:MAG: hypothetical protein AAFX50_11540 [Acidobacteriota bacterium]